MVRVDSHVPLVVIAASAGGLHPISELLEQTSFDPRAATIIIQHLSPDFRSELVKLLQAHANQPVTELAQMTSLEAGRIYVIQPGTQIVLEDNVVRAVARDEFDRPYFTIDVFLESVARRSQPINACVVLMSGTGSDGTQGCRAVYDHGGYVLVQNPDDAKFDGMPQSLVNSGAFHESLPVKAIGKRIRAWLDSGMQTPVTTAKDEIASEGADAEQDPGEYHDIFRLLHEGFDVDFNAYKKGTIERRVRQRMQKCNETSLDAYAHRLARSGAELRALFSDLMIGVTSFFRDPEVFQYLEQHVLPALIARAAWPLKIWVCGCSTGEEAYSIAMLMRKLHAHRPDSDSYRIFATDINAEAIRQAADGGFQAERIMPFVERFGLNDWVGPADESGIVRVLPEVRSSIVFSVQNVIKHSPFPSLDLVLCRNMLIYFKPDVQRKVISNLHFGLRPAGFMVLGESEGPAGLDAYFEEVEPGLKIFRKLEGPRLTSEDRWSLNRNVVSLGAASAIREYREPKMQSVSRHAFEAAFAAVAGDSLIANAVGEVLFLTGRAGDIFNLVPPGRPSLSLHSHIGDEVMQNLLQVCVAETISRGKPLQVDVAHTVKGQWAIRALHCTPLPKSIDRDATVLVQMIAAPVGIKDSARVDPQAGVDLLKVISGTEGGLGVVARLQSENAELRILLGESVQDRETFHEELQSTNEELLASNEELQSTNEELQSVNEELHSVNTELQEKIIQVTEANNDISNLVSTTDVALLFLDDELRIRRYTNVARSYFPLAMKDIGRKLEELSSRISGFDLASEAARVLSDGNATRLERPGPSGTWLRIALFPYRNHEQAIDGVVVTITDVTEMKLALHAERDSRLRRELTEKLLGIGFWEIADLGQDDLELSQDFYTRLGYQPEELGRSLATVKTLIHPDDLQDVEDAMERSAAELCSFSVECRLRTRSGKYLWILSQGTTYRTPEGQLAMLGTHLDIDAAKTGALELEAHKQAMTHSDRIFNIGMMVSGVSHELGNPLSALRLAADVLHAQLETSEPLDRELLRSMVDSQRDAANRMESILSSLLKFARDDGDHAVSMCEVNDLLEDAVRLVDPLARRHGVDLEMTGTLDGARLTCHPVEIVQAFVNLLTNAVHAVAGKPDSWVKFEARWRPGEGLTATVTDAGLRAEIPNPDKLFVPFYTTKGVGRGTGLGLSLAKSIVEAHHGQLYLDRQSANTRFVIRLPASFPSGATKA